MLETIASMEPNLPSNNQEGQERSFKALRERSSFIGNKFADCETFTEITENIKCKVWQTNIGIKIFINYISNFQMVVGTENMNLTQQCEDSFLNKKSANFTAMRREH